MAKQNQKIMAKIAIISDLYKILYTTQLESNPTENWLMPVAIAKSILTYHGLYFREKNEIPDAEYWDKETDVEEHFFDTLHPGKVPSPTAFANICDMHIDWEMWEVKADADALIKAFDAIKNIANKYKVFAIAGTADTLLNNSKAA